MALRKMLALSAAFIIAASTLSAFQAKPIDVTGTWSGTLTPTGSGGGPAHLVLKQKATELTGTAGPGPDKQTPIANGKVTTVKGVTSLAFQAPQPNGAMMTFDLKVVEGRLKGNVTLEFNGDKRQATLDVGRAK